MMVGVMMVESGVGRPSPNPKNNVFRYRKHDSPFKSKQAHSSFFSGYLRSIFLLELNLQLPFLIMNKVTQRKIS